MSLSRLERLQEQAEEERLSKLRAKQALETTDETKRRKKMIEEEQEQTRFAYKALQDNVWYYRDRAGLPRGPCQLSTLRAGWVHGVIDEFTLVWGQGLEAWYPVRNVVSLVANIQSYDVMVMKWFNNKFILQPRLEASRQRRKEFLRAVKKGTAEMSPEKVAELKSECKELGLGKKEPHPALAFYDKIVQEKLAAAAAQAAAAAAAAAAAQAAASSSATGSAAAAAAAQPKVMRGRGAAAACLSLALPLPKGFGQPAQMGRTGGGAVPKAHWLDDAE